MSSCPDDDPEAPIEVTSFGEVEESEVDVSLGLKGGRLHARGIASPAHLMRLVIPPAFCALGFIGGIVILTNGRSPWVALAILAVGCAIAAAFWFLLGRQEQPRRPPQ